MITGGPDWTAIAGIGGTAVVGLLGPFFADQRRFGQDRRLKAVDDLRTMIDEVEDRLEDLGEKCALMRQQSVTYGDDPEHLAPALQEAEDSYQVARAAIARLSIRPHAGDALVGRATDSSQRYMDAIKAARAALIARSMGVHASTSAAMAITKIPGFVEDGIQATRAYEAAAREALGQILGSAEKPRMIG